MSISTPSKKTKPLLIWVYLITLLLVGPAYAQQETPEITVLSETETSYTGAHLLQNGEDVTLGVMSEGRHGDLDDRERYLFWQGDSLFLGVIDTEHNNRLDVVAEFYWFESSLPRNSDFYVIVLKVTAAPTTNTNWRIATPPSLTDSILFREIGAVHRVEASLDRSGGNGAIRWDWSVPFQNYRWEPEQVIEVEQEYTAGAHIEGSAMRDLSGGVNVQAKGFLDAQTRVSTRYTITLWRWEMLVQAGATDMDWALIALDPEHEQDPAYHEYFLVLQAERGVPLRLNHLQFATTMRKRQPLFFDEFKNISVRLQNIELSPPANPCGPNFQFIDGRCVQNCPLNYERIDGLCQLVCSEGFEPIDDECIYGCIEGYEWIDGECVRDCPLNTVNIDNQCEFICEDGSFSIGGVCYYDDCPDGWLYYAGECVSICEDGFLWRNDECVAQCPDDAYHNGQSCICSPGFVIEGDECVSICEDGFRFDGSQCISVCGEGFQFNGTECVPICGAGSEFNGTECATICPEGTALVDQNCMFIEQTCQPGFVWRDQSCQSACPDGFKLRDDGACIQICPQGFIYQNQQCTPQCPQGSRLENGVCIGCPQGTYLNGTQCIEHVCNPATEECPSLNLSKEDEGCQSTRSLHPSLLLLLLSMLHLYLRSRRLLKTDEA